MSEPILKKEKYCIPVVTEEEMDEICIISDEIVGFWLRKKLVHENILPQNKLQCDQFLLRYLRVNRMNTKKAFAMICNYVDEVRKTINPEIFTEIYPKEFANNFQMYFGGCDYSGRPVVMIPQVSLWNIKEVIEKGDEEMFLRYSRRAGQLIERQLLKTSSDYCILVVNCADLSVRNYLHKRTLEIIAKLMRIYESFVPGTIGKIYFVNVSLLALAVVRTVQAIMPSSIQTHCLGYNRMQWTEALLKDIPSESLCTKFGGKFKSQAGELILF